MGIELRSVSKRFGRHAALEAVSLEVRQGELLAILGPSGSGKTTLLRLIAGLERPEAGQVFLGGEDRTTTPARRRRCGFVFQHYALFRHLTVARNIAFGLEVRPAAQRPSAAQIAARVDELLSLVQLDGMADRYPSQLSGGQRQRVALARALALDPAVLLLDEPFGALDATVRRSLRRELRRVHEAAGVTTLFVTHDQDEALELADRVAVMNNGRIEQVGTPREVLEAPATPFVAAFVGQTSRVLGRVENGRFIGALGDAAAEGVPDGPAVALVRANVFRS